MFFDLYVTSTENYLSQHLRKYFRELTACHTKNKFESCAFFDNCHSAMSLVKLSAVCEILFIKYKQLCPNVLQKKDLKKRS